MVMACAVMLTVVFVKPAAGELVLVENGVSRAPIVVFEGAPPFTRRAADELAEYFEKTSGVRPLVIEGRPDPLPEHAIWVGFQPVLQELFPGLNFNFEHPEEILIAASDSHLVIVGRDRWDPEHLVVPGRTEIVGKQQEYGTINAVYTFLRDYLGVRWLWPGATGEDILKKNRLAFAPFEYRYHPQFRQRGAFFRLSALGDNRGLSFDWTRFQRLQMDSLDVPGGHGFTTWWERFHETNPEFFALQPDGTRSGFPGPGIVKMCVSNPGLWAQWLEDVAEQLARDPSQTVFHAAFNDSHHRGHCVCEKCRAWDNLNAVPRRLSWEGLTQEYVALTDRDVTFANTLARLLRERYPERDDYHVLIAAYGPTRPAPVAAVPDDNVIINNVANIFWGLDAVDSMSSDRTKSADQFADWGKVTRKQLLRPNTGSPAGWQQGQPDIAFGRLAEAFRFAAEHNCIGFYVDTVWEYWPTQGPFYYLAAHLLWDPRADTRAVLDDYYARGFGPAAGEISAYWTLLEETRNRKVDGNMPYQQAYDAEFFGRAGGLLDRAATRLADGTQIYRDRLDFLRAGLDFTRLMVETRELMGRFRGSQGTDAVAADKARANWIEMERIARANLMNFNFMRPGARYSRGLHPDHP